jgi:nitroimidazol reductase NimA-like FMN-containing flavoprotein (pyridoxamine 5'-phosphate oxidase superfamily)
MTAADPITSVDERYGAAGARTGWATAQELLSRAEVSWITTVRPDGRPHVTPLITVCDGSTVYFGTGPQERKRRNLAANPHVALTTGTNALHGGTDVVVEGDAVRVTDDEQLRRLADAYLEKYGDDWRYEVRDGAFWGGGADGETWVYAVEADSAFGFGKDPYSQTRWTFRRG